MEALTIMLFIKKLLKKTQRLNKEYLLLFIVIGAIGMLIHSTIAVSQHPPEEILLSTIYPVPSGKFATLRSKVYRDFDNPTNRFVDPVGLSQIESLQVTDQIVTAQIYGPTKEYIVNFASGNAKFKIVYAERFYMDAAGPVDRRAGGKFVYDIAEGVYANDCEAGDVVLISDKDDNADVMKSSGSFANRIAGVISQDPKIYMGSNKHKVPLALAGIVKCKASNENGEIKKGDLLVTASLPGHAMKAMPDEVKSGMIIGKAMESLNLETGKILILVSRQ